MKKIFKNRLVLGSICIIVSIIICFIITPIFNNAADSKVKIARVDSDIKKGEKITDKKIKTVEAGGYNLPNNVILEADKIIGNYAKTDIYKGDYILESKITSSNEFNDDYLKNLNGEKLVVSVTVKSFAAGLSGKLEKGDIVSLIASNYGQMEETVIPPELKYVEVIAATSKSGVDNDVENDEEQIYSTVTFLVTSKQAEMLAELENESTIHTALVYRGNRENAEKFLKAEDEILNSLYPKEESEKEWFYE